MLREPNRSYWIATGLERTRPALGPDRLGESLHYVSTGLLALSWGWIVVTAILTIARLDADLLTPWASVQRAAFIVVPGAAGIGISLIVELLARRRS